MSKKGKTQYIFCDSTYNIILNYIIVSSESCIDKNMFNISMNLSTKSCIDGLPCIKYQFEIDDLQNIFKNSRIKDIDKKLLLQFDDYIYNNQVLDFYYRPKFSYFLPQNKFYINKEYSIIIRYEDSDNIGFLDFINSFNIQDESSLLVNKKSIIHKKELIHNKYQIEFIVKSELLGVHNIIIYPAKINKQLIKKVIIPLKFYQ